MTLQVVWFKRDLRINDHEALFKASQQGPLLCCYVIEDAYWQLADTSNRQWLFIRDSLQELAGALAKQGIPLLIVRAEVTVWLDAVRQHFGQFVLHSHQETGNLWTYQRDMQVAQWCKSWHITWHQYAQQAVLRGSALAGTASSCASSLTAAKKSPKQRRSAKIRDWRQHWHWFSEQALWPKITAQTLAEAPVGWPALMQAMQDSAIICLPADHLPETVNADDLPCPYRQAGGRKQGVMLLKSFLQARGARYQATISSPLTAEQGCSRLSPHLAYGTVSIREVLHQLAVTKATLHDRIWLRSIHAFQSRLVWHCYFIQKLESNPQAECHNMHQLYNALDRPWDAQRFSAWQHGRTGWPLVDACMRYLQAHGWVNFRMRAMLVSIACYTLKLPWQPVAAWLAQLFVDYEPGIHYPQVQMQSGTNGNQVLRMYNPLTQAQQLDPQGDFVRRWVPELSEVPTAWIFTPWQLPQAMRERFGCQMYPEPMVDFVLAHRQAKAEVSRLRQIPKKPAKNANNSHLEPSVVQISLFAD